jgi:hypothetical protein
MEWTEPKLGDVRTHTEFLFLPTCIDDKCRWLKWATIKQVYSEGAQDEWGNFERYWDNVAWVD